MTIRSLFMSVVLLSAASAFASTAHYDISYDGENVVHVVAQLPAGDGRLLIGQSGGIDHLPDQWATFVHDVRVTTRDGAASPSTPAGKEGWTTASHDAVNVRYDVVLDYAVGQWPAGNEQSGRRFANALYTITKPLFLYTPDVTEAEVHFTVPDGWRVATPWETTGRNTFKVGELKSLIWNSIVVGKFPSIEVHVGAFDITVATPGSEATPPLLGRALGQIGAIATNLFDKTPRGKYLMTFFREDSEDGESYLTSAAITSPDPFDRAGMIVTGNTLVHELLHHWIGGQIAPAEHDSMAWFTEGFTEYYANIALARSGAVPPDLMLRKMNNQVAGYLYFFGSSLFSGVTVGEAGRKKGAYRFGVYNGGWAVALSLDVRLRSESKGRRSLDDVMRLLYERNGLAAKPLTTADIRKAVEDVSGTDCGAFFDTYIVKRNPLPIADTLAKLGIELRGQPYAADMFLIEMASPAAEQTELRKAMFGF